ncbi:DNA-binding protein [Listeria monocytogenes]|nr:DNA-binding protein [Listeria monocytogenes]
MEFLNAKQVADLLQISESGAYVEIRILNAEIMKKGFRIKRGRVNRKFFEEAYGFMNLNVEKDVVNHELA